MLRIMKADLFRLVRGKGIYIIGMLVVGILIVSSVAKESFGVNVSFSEKQSNQNEDGALTIEYSDQIAYTGREAVAKNMQTSDNNFYFMLALIVIIALVDFSDGNIKNVLTGGVSRSKYFMSKWMTAIVFAMILMVLNYLVPFIIGSVLNGIGGEAGDGFVMDFLVRAGLQTLLTIAVVSFGIFLVFASRRASVVIGGYMALCLLPMTVLMILSDLNPKLYELYKYELIYSMKMLSVPDLLERIDLVRIFIEGIVITGICIFGGIQIFKKSDVR